MNFKLLRFFASKSFGYALLCLYAVLLALATWLEAQHGTAWVQEGLYHHPAFIALQGIIALNLLLLMVRGRYLKRGRYGIGLLHASLLVILAGALVTHLTGREGYMHLREGQTASFMKQHEQIIDLPFALELQDFTLKRYPGSSSPASYESQLILHEKEQKREVLIYMNHTLDVQGYRVFQLSYDPDERGSVLLISEDYLGRRITYAGYLLLALGFALCFWSKQGRVRQLLARLQAATKLLLLALIALGAELKASKFEELAGHIVPKQEAQRFAALPMQDTKGRIVPIETFASQILRKLHRQDKIMGWTPTQFVLSVWLQPEHWLHVRFIHSPNTALAARLGLPQNAISLADVLSEQGHYQLEEEIEAISRKKANERSRAEKELLKLDERVNLFYQLWNGQLIKIFPKLHDAKQRWFAPGDDWSGHFEGEEANFVSKILPVYLTELKEKKWQEAARMLSMLSIYQQAKGKDSGLNEEKIQAELRYNEWRIFPRSQLAYLILGGCMLTLTALRHRLTRPLFMLLWLLVFIVFMMHAYGMGLRWYIASYAPWSNSYETMVYIAWVSALLGLLAASRSRFVAALSVLFAGIVLFVSSLSWMDPHISPLVPVLQSAWLAIHVAVIVAAYAFFGIAFLLAVSNLLLLCIKGNKARSQLQKLSDIKEIFLWLGLSLMVIGSCLGAIWANESWGRYWAWDPKETWALITILCYTLCTHLRLLPKLYSLYAFNVLSMLSFLSVLMTYFGVNYFLSGMHSYNSSQLPENVLFYLSTSLGLLILLALGAGLRLKSSKP